MKMKTKLLGAALALVVVGGSVAGLTVNTFASTLSAAAADNQNDNDQEVADDVQQPGQDKEVADDVEQADKDQEVADDVELANLQQQAKLTKEQAIAIATAQVQGTVKDTQLEDEDGAVVYNVQIQDSKGQITEVKVDAKTGAITKQEQADDKQESQDAETNDDQQ